MKTKIKYSVYLTGLMIFISNVLYAATWYSKTAQTVPTTLTNWTSASNGTGGSPANFTTAGDLFIIQAGHSYTSTSAWTLGANVNLQIAGTFNPSSFNFTVGGNTTILGGGTFNDAALAGINTFTGSVSNSGTWTSTVVTTSANLVFNGGISNNNTFNAGGATFNTSPQSLAGTSTITFAGLVVVTGITVTNNGTVSMSSTAAGTLSGTGNWTQGANSTLNYSGSTLTITSPVFNTGAGNTVAYNRAGIQTINSLPVYTNLSITVSGTKTLSAPTGVNGNLVISGTATLDCSTFQITGNATGVFTMAAGTNLLLGANASPTVVSFPTSFTNSNTTLNSTSTVSYNTNAAQTISTTPTYGNLTVTTGAATVVKTLSGPALNVAGNLTITGPTSTLNLDAATNTINVTGNVAGTGDLSFTTGNLNIGGDFTHTGVFSCGTGTVNFNGGAQNARSLVTTYYNLTASASNTKTLLANINVNNNLVLTGTPTLACSTFQITGNASGIVNISAGASLVLGTTASATIVLFPTNYVAGNITLNATSSVTYQSDNAGQNIFGGITYGNLIIANGATVVTKSFAANIIIAGDLTLTNGAGALTLSGINNTINLTGNFLGTGNLSFTTGNFTIGGNYNNTGNFTAGTNTITFNGSSAQSYNSSNALPFYNFAINNPNGLTLNNPMQIANMITLMNGKITTTPTNILTLNNGAVCTLGNASAYVNGPMNYIKASTGSTTLNFPIGKGVFWRPAVLTVSHSNTSSVTYYVEMMNSSAQVFGYAIPGSITEVSDVRYWKVTRTPVANLTTATAQLYYDGIDGVTDFGNLTLVKATASPWVDAGGTATGNTTGSITSNAFATIGNPEYFTIANKTAGANVFNPQSCPGNVYPSISQVAANVVAGTCDNWINLSNTKANDATYTSCTFVNTCTNNLALSQFGYSFSSSATICGIEVRVKLKASAANQVSDLSMVLFDGASPSPSDLAQAGFWSTTDATVTYGGPGNLWGWASVDPLTINSNNFGIRFRAQTNTVSAIANVDYIEMKVYAYDNYDLVTQSVSATSFCPSQAITVTFTSSTFDPGNVFTAQISNSSGSFAAPTNIGSVTSTTALPINATLPGGIVNSSLYKIRVVANTPAFNGTEIIGLIGVNVPANPGVITGNNNMCLPQTGITYSVVAVPFATSYNWTLPSGGVITAGAGTNSITVNFPGGSTSGNVTVSATNLCGTGTTSTRAVSLNASAPATPGSISGLTNVYQGQTAVPYNITAVAGAASYTWTLTTPYSSIASGGTTNSITVNFTDSATSGTLSVIATNACGSSSPSPNLPITLSAFVPAAVCSTANRYCGINTSYPAPIAGTGEAGPNYGCLASQPRPAWFYFQVTNSGTFDIVLASTSANDVDFICYGPFTSPVTPCTASLTPGNTIDCSYTTAASETINVVGAVSGKYYLFMVTNYSGTNFDILVSGGTGFIGAPPAAGAITGASTTCPLQNGIPYSISAVTNATTYNWALPSGVTIATGTNTNSITANFGAGAVSGNIVVTPSNACGTSGATTKPITLAPILIASAGADLTICSGGTATIGGSPTGSGGTTPYTYLWSPATNLSSSTIANPIVSPVANQTYTVNLTDANGCIASDGIILAVPAANGGVGTWTWLGLTTDWFDPCNWDKKCLPDASSDVVIPGGTPNNAVITGATANCKTLNINVTNGGFLNIVTTSSGKLIVAQ